MATQQPQAETQTTLRLTRTFAAPREKVFRAWTDREALKKWFAPSEQYTTNIPELDLKVGGRYRVEMKSPDGKVHCVAGTYREVRKPEKLVYTWTWENEPAMGETLVTVEFRDRGSSTEVILTHELFPNEKAREEHKKGWGGCLDRLEKFLA